MTTNAEIIRLLDDLANLLEVEDESPFRIRAYRNAVDTLRMLDPPLSQMVTDGADLTELQDIGPGIAKKIREICADGVAVFREKLAVERSPGVLELLRLPGLGPKRVRLLRDQLQIHSLDDLRAALAAGRLKEVPGFGKATEDKLRKRLDKLEGTQEPGPAADLE